MNETQELKLVLKKGLAWLMIALVLNLTISCRHYYTYNRDTNPSIEKVDKLKNSPNYMIVHQADLAFHLTSIKVDNDAKTISGTIEKLSPDHLKYLSTKPYPGSSNRYRKKASNPLRVSTFVVNEVHLYVNNQELVESESITIPMAAIEKIEVYDPDTGATTASYILGGVIVAASAVLVIFIVILLTKSSCPFVYVNNGQEFVFAGEIFGGAIFKSIERDDYLFLPVSDTVRSIEITISNKLKEKQFINQLKLLQVEHPMGTQILPDRRGQMHLLKNKQSLISAQCGSRNVTDLLKDLDSVNFLFDVEEGENYFNDVVLTFPKPSSVQQGHLILHAKNSLWGDYLFGEFTHLFGKSYSSWIEKQNQKSPDEVGHWAEEQGLALQVCAEVNNEWIYVDKVDLAGPLAFRDIVVPIDLTSHDQNSVRIKITSAFMMWDMDYAAMDFSADDDITLKELPLAQAITNAGTDSKNKILQNDGNYLEQLNTGDELFLSYSIAAPQLDRKKSFVLFSRGYYQHVRDYENTPDIVQLLQFKSEGKFSRFSKEKFDEFNLLMESTVISSSVKQVED